jgi:hypothetical protein
MKVLAVLSLVSLALGSVLEQRACPGNNCNRAVTGTRAGILPASSRSADCSSYLLTTVTPAAVTVTVTDYADGSATSSAAAKREELHERQVTVVPSAVPTYASACSDPGDYASACSCFGITGKVTTAATPTVTSTTTVDTCEDL